MAKGLLFASFDFSTAHADEFHDWYDLEHVPEHAHAWALPGLVTIAHNYKKAGIYQVNIKVTDVNGVSAFLQVVAVSSGKVDGAAAGAGDNKDTTGTAKTEILWIPAAVGLVLLLPAYWLGRRSQIVSLHNKMLKERDAYNKD